MNRNEKRMVNKYIREIQHLLPIIRQTEKRFLADFRQTIDDYCQTTNEISYEVLINVFGEPKDLASNYILEQEPTNLRNAIRFTHYIKIFTITIILSFLAIIGIRGYAEYQAFQNSKEAYIQREVIVIEEMEE